MAQEWEISKKGTNYTYNSSKKEGQSTMHKLEVAGLQPSANVVPLKSGKGTAKRVASLEKMDTLLLDMGRKLMMTQECEKAEEGTHNLT